MPVRRKLYVRLQANNIKFVRSNSCKNKKVKFTLEQGMKAQRRSRGIALLFP
jgi:hypothetical protein